jgi:hypothetical protein
MDNNKGEMTVFIKSIFIQGKSGFEDFYLSKNISSA